MLRDLPKKSLWGLLLCDFYGPDALPVAQPTVSKHRRNRLKAVVIVHLLDRDRTL